jgi:hypothetical protein
VAGVASLEVKVWQGMASPGESEVRVGNVQADHATLWPLARDFRGEATRATSDIQDIAAAADARELQEHRRQHLGPTAEKI